MIKCPGCGESFDPQAAERRGDLAQCPHCKGWFDATAAAARQGDEVRCDCGNTFGTGWREVRNGMVQCSECGGWIDVDAHLVHGPRPKKPKCPSCETLVGPGSAVMRGEDGKNLVLCPGCSGWFTP